MLKKLITLLLCLLVSIFMISCGDDSSDDNNSGEQGKGDSDVTFSPDGGIDLPIIDVEFN